MKLIPNQAKLTVVSKPEDTLKTCHVTYIFIEIQGQSNQTALSNVE